MAKDYAGWKKGYLNKGERIAYAKKLYERTHCLMPGCELPAMNYNYCLNHFPKVKKVHKR